MTATSPLRATLGGSGPETDIHSSPLSRRHLLKALGVGAATVVVTGTGALSYRTLDSGVLDPGSGRAYDPWLQWRDGPGPLGAVAAATLAANPHNTQPWIFRVTDDAIDVHIDVARTTGTLDPYDREQHVGLGCALENLELACRARGLDPTIELLPDGTNTTRVAHVALTAGSKQSSPLYESIGRRHTNRGPYDGRSLPFDTLTALADAGSLTGVATHWVTGADQKAALGHLLVDAAAAITRDKQQSRDSFTWFRGDNDAVQRHSDGLTLDAQGLSPLMLSMAKLLPASSRSAGDRFWVEQTRTVHTATAAVYGVLTAVDPDDRRTQLVAGRLLQRIHLTATSTGIALHHMNQITERMDRERATGAAATLGPRIAALLPPGAKPLATFRVGYPLREARVSPRRPVSAVTW